MCVAPLYRGRGLDDDAVTIAQVYLDFAEREAHGVSPTYERLCWAVSRDPEVLALLDTAARRQPNLLFAVVRLLGGPVDDPVEFRDFVVRRWPVIEPQLRTRTTQTNEPGRCALLVPVLAALPQPLGLLEVGASAGLCLYPDRYRYRYGPHVVGERGPVIDCDAQGLSPPRRLPEVVWRAGLDLNPLDVTDPEDRAWLEALIWPEHDHRRERLRAAAEIAAAEPPLLVRVISSTICLPCSHGRLSMRRSSSSIARCCTRCRRHGVPPSSTSCADWRRTGSPSRRRTCSPTRNFRRRPISRRSTSSRSTAAHSRGPAATARACSGSPDLPDRSADQSRPGQCHAP